MAVKRGCITKERRKNILDRLKRIDGQIAGVVKMVEEDRYCMDILQQVSSVFEALRGVTKVLMHNYLEICATNAIQTKRKERQEAIYSELMDAMFKFTK